MSLLQPQNRGPFLEAADYEIPDAGPAVQLVTEALGARIASGDYPPGSRLPSERQLASSLRVARNTLREALDILVRKGLISRRAGAGSYVSEPGEWDEAAPVIAATGPLHLQVVRGILEPEMIRLAIINIPPLGIDRLNGVLARMQATNEPARFARMEDEFRLILAEGTGNPLLLACLNLVIKAGRQRHRDGLQRRRLTPDNIQRLRTGYAALADAVSERDIPRALELVQQSLLEEQDLLMQEG
ncbi:GntR family transcriptional regulator [Paracoccus sp. MBLB3053]|uniref:GntR family transcriptional regulator n=1 Tax=Paracoccus aurantius TaxID=3073814 RepID=A0ABU2HYF8_9RHOB|nr:GntR family transcriptional regulator [Paracoccus sp. MBLB3053]MDS9469530.1 GntR family transcriptional regulator [Paracoccus sp. MBLB3053]